MKKHNFRKSVYIPRNKEKYIGKSKHCIARSSWERKFMEYCETSASIVSWCSECVVVPYMFNGKMRRYFPDFLVIMSDGRKVLIEIKPARETKPPRKTKKKSKKTIMYESVTYIRNQKKWESAQAFCHKKGWEFKILTEKELKI